MTATSFTAINRALGARWWVLVLSWLALVCLGGIAQPDEVGWAAILSAYSFIIASVLLVGTGWMAPILAVALVLRLTVLFVDIYTEIPVFGSGGDTENYYNTALAIYANPALFGENLYGGIFPQVCGVLFWVIGPSRLFIQFTNVLLGVATAIFVGRTLSELGVSSRIGRPVLWIYALMPIPAMISALFLRESLIAMLVSASTFGFARWLRRGETRWILQAFILVALASTLHLGVLGLAAGYGFTLLFYDRNARKFSFSVSSLVRGLPIVAIVLFVIVRFPSLFLEKLERVSNAEDAIALATGSTAGSAYLTGVEIDSPASLLLFSGLKGLYLLISPLPMDWRGGNDAVSFILDSVFYLTAIVVILRALLRSRKALTTRTLRVVLAGLVASVLVLGIGTGAAGTAMRHRQKVLPVIAVTVALALAAGREREFKSLAEDEGPQRQSSAQ